MIVCLEDGWKVTSRSDHHSNMYFSTFLELPLVFFNTSKRKRSTELVALGSGEHTKQQDPCLCSEKPNPVGSWDCIRTAEGFFFLRRKEDSFLIEPRSLKKYIIFFKLFVFVEEKKERK